MSIALERSGNWMEGEVTFRGISCVPLYGPPQIGVERTPTPPVAAPIAPPAAPARWSDGGPGAVMPPARLGEEEEASCMSSIGSDSDGSDGSAAASGGEGSGEPEVQSALKRPLDALEEALPIRRGISKFYKGKSKSFTSLADATSFSSSEDLAKPENAYTRKRKNLLAFSIHWDHHQGAPLRSTNAESMTKRPANSSRSTEGENNLRLSQRPLRPPLPPNGKISLPPSRGSPPQRCHFAVRSFSLTDLQGAATVTDSPSIVPMDKLQQRSH